MRRGKESQRRRVMMNETNKASIQGAQRIITAFFDNKKDASEAAERLTRLGLTRDNIKMVEGSPHGAPQPRTRPARAAPASPVASGNHLAISSCLMKIVTPTPRVSVAGGIW